MASVKSLIILFTAAAALGAAFGALAAEANAAVGKTMKMDDPMPTAMKKKGMKKGDVKKAAEKKQREMKPIIDKESADATKK